MDPLGATSSLIAILQLSFEVASYIRTASGASKDRKELLKELRSCEDVLKALLDDVGDCEEGEAWSETVKALESPDGPLHAIRQALQTVKNKLQPSPGFTNKVKGALAWPFQEKEVQKLIDLIERQKALLLVALANDSRKLSRDIKKTAIQTAAQLAELSGYMRKASHGLTILQNDIRYLRTDQDVQAAQKERQDVLDWISGTDYTAQQNDFITRRQQGTGQWLLDSREFQKWKASRGQTLFCPGIPGAGKTMGASIAVDCLESIRDPDTGVAYIYCNFRRQDEQGPYELLTSLLGKLSRDQKWDSVRRFLTSLYNKHKQRQSRPSTEEIGGALQSVCFTYSRVFLVIDALDECRVSDGSLSTLLAEIRRLQDSCGANLLVTSRPIPDIRSMFLTAAQLEIRATPEDVARYLQHHLSRLPGFVQRNQELQEEIKTAIIESTQGMFLLAQLHLDSLIGKRSVKAVRLALSRLPTGSGAYDRAYDDAMERIEAQVADQTELAKQVLSWITLARRPLKTVELQYALATEIDEPALDPDNISEIDDIMSACLGLVTIDDESGIIRLVHYTTQEYLDRTKDRWFPRAEEDVLAVCITSLNFAAFDDKARNFHVRSEAFLGEYPLHNYASTYWAEHSRGAPVTEAMLTFLMTPQKAQLSHQDMRRPFLPIVRGVSGPHLLAWFGLARPIKALIDRGCDFNQIDWKAQSPLHWAAERGATAVIEELITQLGDDLEVDLGDRIGRTPFIYAASHGHEAVVMLLLQQQRVRPNRRDKYGKTAFYLAVDRGHTSLVHKLIANDTIEVDTEDEIGRRPLALAASLDHFDIVKLLVASGRPDVNPTAPTRSPTPLWFAAGAGRVDVIECLLAARARVDSYEDTGGQTPLSYALRMAHDDAARILLHHGADATKCDEELRSMLHHALRREGPRRGPWWATNPPSCSLRTVELLIRSGAPLDTLDTNNMSPMLYAVDAEREDVAELLLQHGMNVNAAVTRMIQERILWPTSTASEDSDEDALSTFDTTGAPAGMKQLTQELTPLHLAALVGIPKMVTFLLSHGADPGLRTSDGQMPLHLAICGDLRLGEDIDDRWADVLQRIENQGPLREECEDDGTYPDQVIQAYRSAIEQRLEVIKALLDHPGTDVRGQDATGASPLHCALVPLLVPWLISDSRDLRDRRWWLPDRAFTLFTTGLMLKDSGRQLMVHFVERTHVVVKMLIDRGADVSAVDMDNRTALHLACLYGELPTISVLLAHGADPLLKDQDGHNALQCAAIGGNCAAVARILQTGGLRPWDLSKTVDGHGRTPLHHLCWGRRADVETTRVLIEAGCDIKRQDSAGQTPLDVYLGYDYGYQASFKNLPYLPVDPGVCQLLTP